ncbi:LysR family transcriptional regulator [Leucobacter massiliensis]|uniref:HTH lysR-type domain-containing protein n=1 Tax=Leucobacter massiliensis TaxID=1686285 RepID=A0A2S9QMA0_9MICO|nr:LysR family transcriptional regulator [Leucobacter massiliensis]PRI10708.1 hypothetical protein B4915_07335 [Leucobacter massiliensis]
MLEHIGVFLELARAGSLRGAASRLGLDETTVSRRLTRLEESLGVRLMDRGRERWRLTEAGRRLLPHAEAIDSEVVAATQEVVPGSGELSGALRVVTSDGFGAYVLMPQLQEFHERHPALRIEVSTSTTHAAATERDFDVAITLERPSSRFAEVRALTDYELKFYATQEYLDTHGTPGSAAELRRDHTLIWYVDALLDVEQLRLLDIVVPHATAMIQTNNIAGHLEAARAGLGVALLPTYIGERAAELRPVLHDQLSARRRYWVAVPRATLLLARVTAFCSALDAIVSRHPQLLPVAGSRAPGSRRAASGPGRQLRQGEPR